VREVRVVVSRTFEMTFDDGALRTIDLTPLLWGPVFAEIAADDEAFNAVHLAPETLYAADADETRSPAR
jgi:hypothetical protein